MGAIVDDENLERSGIEGDEAENQIDDLAEKYIGQRPYPWRQGETRVKVVIEPVRVHQM